MQINRLFEIVYLLLDKKNVTAAELAERFEVSVRTIYRDLETLSEAGIPLYCERGKKGGIRLTSSAYTTNLQRKILPRRVTGIFWFMSHSRWTNGCLALFYPMVRMLR